jgi:hypothetical protein
MIASYPIQKKVHAHNPYVQYYKAGELSYSHVQIYELYIDEAFTNGASSDQLTFELDEELIQDLALDEVTDIPWQSQSQSSEPRQGLAHQTDESSVDLDHDSEASVDDYQHKDEELAFQYKDGTDCCYDYPTVQKAMSTFQKFKTTFSQQLDFSAQETLFHSVIESSKSLLAVESLPKQAYDKWKTTYCPRFIKGTFSFLFSLLPCHSTPNE